ncbi:MAG: amidohydrolase [Erysipelotrichaceae bacterium]|nr:amidohydrolase [Erysipelotrichaceae bacterium]
MRTIDFHAHPVTDAFRQAMTDLNIDVLADDGFPLPKWSAEDHLAFMDQAGIDFTVLSTPTPHIYNGDPVKAAQAVRAVNEETAQIVKQHPDRFAFAAALPLPAIQESIAEAEYALSELGAAGIKVPTNAFGMYLGDPSMDPVMEVLNRHRALVIIHPCRAKERPANVITGTVAAIFEYPTDTTRAVINMIAHRIMTRFPEIRWVVPHCGSFLPYMLQRFTGVSGILAGMGMMETVDAKEEFSRLYFDIAGDPEPVGLNMLRMVADESHIVFGSDFPHSPAPVILKKKQHFDVNPEYDGIRERIYSANGETLLKGE